MGIFVLRGDYVILRCTGAEVKDGIHEALANCL